MIKSYHLAIDLGASSGRAILACYDGESVTLDEVSRFRYPIVHSDEHMFWDLPGIYKYVLDAIDKAKNKLVRQGEAVASIGVDSWGCDVAFFNADGSLAGLPYCYRDPHTRGAIEEFASRMSLDEVYNRTGIQFMPFNTLFQLATIKERAARILWIPDAIAYMLTGVVVTEYTVASTSQMLNAATGELDSELLALIDVERDCFGPMVNPGHIIGYYQDIPVVAVAGHDTASAVVAIPSWDANFAYLSCGTWSLMGIESPYPIINDKSRKYNFTNEGGVGGTIRVLKNICGMWIFEQCRAEFTDAPTDTGELVALCEHSACDSIINPDDESFANPKSMTAAIRNYCRATGQCEPETPADYVRVTFHSLARRYREVLDMLRELSHVDIQRLHVIGGGSLNSYLMQLTANELEMPVVAGPAESTALGNALLQLVACGKASLPELRRIAIESTNTKTYIPCKK